MVVKQTGPIEVRGAPPNRDEFGKKQVFPPQVTTGALNTNFQFQLDFSAATIRVTNLSNFWLYIDAAQLYIPPQSLGALYALPYPLQSFNMVVLTPQGGLGGFTLPTVNGLVFVTAYENKLTDYAGVLSLSTVVSNQLPPVLNNQKLSISVDGWGGVALGGGEAPDSDQKVGNITGDSNAFNYNYNPVDGTWDRVRGDRFKGLDVNPHPAIFEFNTAGGANAAATLTIPAAGAGVHIYITFLRITRIATAALAGGAILTVTTTNLNGVQYRCGNNMIAGGTDDLIKQDFGHALRSQVSNTAITFVAPAAGAAVSWDMQAHAFTAP